MLAPGDVASGRKRPQPCRVPEISGGDPASARQLHRQIEQRLVAAGPADEGQTCRTAAESADRQRNLRQPGQPGDAGHAHGAKAKRFMDVVRRMRQRSDRRTGRKHQHGAGLGDASDAIACAFLHDARLRRLVLGDLCRGGEAFGDAGAEFRLHALDEIAIDAPDLARLDDAEGLAPGVEAIGRNALARRRGQVVRHGGERLLHQVRDFRIGFRKGVIEHDQVRDFRRGRSAAEQHAAHFAERARSVREPAGDIEGRRHVHRAGEIDAAMRGADAIEPAERGRHPDRTAGIAADRDIAGAGSRRRCRAARRAAGQAAGRARIVRRAVMRVDAGDAVEEFVADGLAGDGGAGIEQLLHDACVLRRGRLRCEPVRIAAAGALAFDVIHVLDRDGQPGERAGLRAANRRLQVVRNEGRADARNHHAAFCWPRYQSRIFSPVQDTTPGFSKISLKVRSTCPIRCGTPER